MKIAITGSPRSGKTTLVKELLQYINAVGFYTEEVRRNGRRYGFDIITTWERNFHWQEWEVSPLLK